MKTKNTPSLALLLSAGLLIVAGNPLLASENDDRIEAAAKKSYVYKSYLNDDSIKTSSKDGVVTLTGTVANDSHRSLAQDTVESLPGVTRVENRLTIKGEPKTDQAEHSDTWISTKLRTVLLFHRNVSVSKTGIDVKDGVVTLTGEASSQAQKDLTTEYAKDIDHVKEVRNNMTVASKSVSDDRTTGEKIDDASITAQVKATLTSHRSTSGIKTKVNTMDGVVTVGGVAKNEAEKSLVTKLVNDVHGVISVVNQMTVGVPVATN